MGDVDFTTWSSRQGSATPNNLRPADSLTPRPAGDVEPRRRDLFQADENWIRTSNRWIFLLSGLAFSGGLFFAFSFFNHAEHFSFLRLKPARATVAFPSAAPALSANVPASTPTAPPGPSVEIFYARPQNPPPNSPATPRVTRYDAYGNPLSTNVTAPPAKVPPANPNAASATPPPMQTAQSPTLRVPVVTRWFAPATSPRGESGDRNAPSPRPAKRREQAARSARHMTRAHQRAAQAKRHPGFFERIRRAFAGPQATPARNGTRPAHARPSRNVDRVTQMRSTHASVASAASAPRSMPIGGSPAGTGGNAGHAATGAKSERGASAAGRTSRH